VANPTFVEGQVFARYLDQAAEGFFRLMLGRRAVDIIARAFVEPGHDLSHQNVTFAQHGQDIVGMISGYTAEQHRRSSNRPLKQAAGRWNLRMMVASFLCAPLMRIIDTVADGDFYLQAVAVDEQLRGQGVGSTLIDSIEARALAVGSARLALDVSAKNTPLRAPRDDRPVAVAEASADPRIEVLPDDEDALKAGWHRARPLRRTSPVVKRRQLCYNLASRQTDFVRRNHGCPKQPLPTEVFSPPRRSTKTLPAAS